MRFTTILSCIVAGGSLLVQAGAQRSYDPRLGALVRLNQGQPILSPQGNGFEAAGVFNPAVVRDGDRFVMLYRAPDTQGISRLGYATSTDGVTFTREAAPVLGPDAEYERVFVEGLVVEPRRWLVYYGGADKHIGAASVAVVE